MESVQVKERISPLRFISARLQPCSSTRPEQSCKLLFRVASPSWMAEFRGGRLENLILNPRRHMAALLQQTIPDYLSSHHRFWVVTLQILKLLTRDGDQAEEHCQCVCYHHTHNNGWSTSSFPYRWKNIGWKIFVCCFFLIYCMWDDDEQILPSASSCPQTGCRIDVDVNLNIQAVTNQNW